MEGIILCAILAIICFCVYLYYDRFEPDSGDSTIRVDTIIKDNYSVHMNTGDATKQQMESTARAAVLGSIANEVDLITATGTAAFNHNENGMRLREQRKVEQATSENQVTYLNEATSRKVSPEISDQIRLKEEESKIKVDEYREIKEIDKDQYQFEKNIDVQGAIIASLQPVYQVNLLTQQLDKVLADREMWLKQPDSDRKKKMLKRLDRNIKLLNEAIDAKGQGLIQGNDRPQLGSMD